MSDPDHVEHYIDPWMLRQGTTIRTLLLSDMHVFIQLKEPAQPVLFAVKCEGFEFSAWIDERYGLCLERNGVRVRAQIKETACMLTLAWSPTSLHVDARSLPPAPRWSNEQSEDTPVSGPPRWTIDWLVKQATEKEKDYESREALLNEVVEQLQALAAKIEREAGGLSFWDTVRKGNRIVSRKPKSEPEVTRLLQLLLSDVRIIKNVDIQPQAVSGDGRIDFLCTGRIRPDGQAKVCVEAKLAHSDDLADGLHEQLPAYMQSQATELAVFLVIDFGPDYPPVAVSRGPHWSGKLKPFTTLTALLPLAVREVGPQVRYVIIPVSKGLTPSTKGAAKRRAGKKAKR